MTVRPPPRAARSPTTTVNPKRRRVSAWVPTLARRAVAHVQGDRTGRHRVRTRRPLGAVVHTGPARPALARQWSSVRIALNSALPGPRQAAGCPAAPARHGALQRRSWPDQGPQRVGQGCQLAEPALRSASAARIAVTNPRRSPRWNSTWSEGRAEQCGEEQLLALGDPPDTRRARPGPRCQGGAGRSGADEVHRLGAARTVGPPLLPRPRPKRPARSPPAVPATQFSWAACGRASSGQPGSAGASQQTGTRARRPPCRLARSRPSRCSVHRQAGQLLDGLGQAARAPSA